MAAQQESGGLLLGQYLHQAGRVPRADLAPGGRQIGFVQRHFQLEARLQRLRPLGESLGHIGALRVALHAGAHAAIDAQQQRLRRLAQIHIPARHAQAAFGGERQRVHMARQGRSAARAAQHAGGQGFELVQKLLG